MVFRHGDLINNIRLRGQHQCKSFRLTSKMQILQERKLVYDPTSAKGNRWPPHRTPIRIKVPLNVPKSPLLNCLYRSNCLKLTTSALDMPNRHGGSPAALAPSGKVLVKGDVATSVLIGLRAQDQPRLARASPSCNVFA